MEDTLIPDDVRRFILTCIPSVPHIEALLLLRREPQGPWSARHLAARLYVSEKVASEALRDLTQAGFLAAEGPTPIFRYDPGSAAQTEMVDRVAGVYRDHLIEVTNLIHGKSVAIARQFAEAFRFRKE